jgi:hypothetical protein
MKTRSLPLFIVVTTFTAGAFAGNADKVSQPLLATSTASSLNADSLGIVGSGAVRSQGIVGSGAVRSQGIVGSGAVRSQGIVGSGAVRSQGIVGSGAVRSQGIVGSG